MVSLVSLHRTYKSRRTYSQYLFKKRTLDINVQIFVACRATCLATCYIASPNFCYRNERLARIEYIAILTIASRQSYCKYDSFLTFFTKSAYHHSSLPTSGELVLTPYRPTSAVEAKDWLG